MSDATKDEIAIGIALLALTFAIFAGLFSIASGNTHANAEKSAMHKTLIAALAEYRQ